MTDSKILEALRETLAKDPRNGPLWLHFADLSAQAGDVAGAISALRTASQLPDCERDASRRLVPLLRESGELAEAMIRAEKLLEEQEDPELRAELDRILAERGAPASATPVQASQPSDEASDLALAAVQPESLDDEDWAKQFDWGDLKLSFDDVAGLEVVKRQIHLRIIAPFKQPEIYQAFRRESGGGILLYGPPGCGKTFVARATAGELDARFVSVSIHEIVDKYWGESEKLVHSLFEDARRNSPTVLFFDEFDALGSTRGGSGSQFWKTLVDQLLQEMDGVKGTNSDILLFAATNVPWHVDPAFRRPGRFDRVLFVPPPDATAREKILRQHAAKLPGGESVDVRSIARETELFTGADLRALCERSAEAALEKSLETGRVHEVSAAEFERTLKDVRSTALEWLATARNHARYSNDGGQYDELVGYLKRAKRW